jgi:hypothetical protein
MQFILMLSAIALSSALATPGAFAAPEGERSWLSIAQVHEKLQAAGYHNIEKIEREHGAYEARATDRNGQRIKVYLNPKTGEIMGSRAKADNGGARVSADCTKRRCRDDVSQGKAP